MSEAREPEASRIRDAFIVPVSTAVAYGTGFLCAIGANGHAQRAEALRRPGVQ
jgi:hypothetical protein